MEHQAVTQNGGLLFVVQAGDAVPLAADLNRDTPEFLVCMPADP